MAVGGTAVLEGLAVGVTLGVGVSFEQGTQSSLTQQVGLSLG